MELVRLFNNTKKETTKGNVPARVTKMSTQDLVSWGSVLIMQLGLTYDNWHYHDGSADEVTETVQALSYVWEELRGRKVD